MFVIFQNPLSLFLIYFKIVRFRTWGYCHSASSFHL